MVRDFSAFTMSLNVKITNHHIVAISDHRIRRIGNFGIWRTESFTKNVYI